MSRKCVIKFRPTRAAAVSSVLAGAMMFAGCAADVRRLDNPNYGMSNAPVPPARIGGRSSAGAPSPYDNSGWGDQSGPRAGSPPPSKTYERVAALPPQSEPAVNPSVPFDAPKQPRQSSVRHPVQSTIPVVAGKSIEVQPGDTLTGIAKTYRVSIGALMDLNGLKSPNELKPGQKLTLPANARRPALRPEAVAAATPTAIGVSAPASPPPHPTAVAAAPAPAAGPAAAAAPHVAAPVPADGTSAGWDGTYTIKPGDSLYGIARRNHTTVAELQRVNGIADPLKIKPGSMLKVPGSGGAAQQQAVAAAPAETPIVPTALPPASPPTALPTTKVASVGPAALPPPPAPPTSLPPAPASAGTPAAQKFHWPARGTILAGYGKRPDGTNNDGINIAVPEGTDITAADSGTVAYAGNEIKAYGNLVLIRHEGGWVTAYAHASEIAVKRGDAIKKGQVIAKAGASGSVDQPQIHFELRQGSKPVDPAPYMDR